MQPKIIDSHFTAFWGVFLNLECNLRCPYCIQKVSLPSKPLAKYRSRKGREWTDALNAIANRSEPRFLRPPRLKKLSILGGEPTVYPDFLYVLNNLDRRWKITVTSNFDSPFFDQELSELQRIKNKSRIRFNGSLHFLYTPVERFIDRVQRLKKARLLVHTLFVVEHPAYADKVLDYKKKLSQIHPRVKLQRFLGFYQERLYPQESADKKGQEQKDGIVNYRLYQKAFGQKNGSSISCHSDKVLIAPNGDVYNCHYKLYTGHKDKLGNLFSDSVHLRIPRGFFPCADFGFCNPCDSEAHAYKHLNGKIESISAA
ncbi:radical SAM protein [Candidatus Omnitrophota bacterium]